MTLVVSFMEDIQIDCLVTYCKANRLALNAHPCSLLAISFDDGLFASAENVVLFADFGECVDRPVNVGELVPGGKLHANAGEALCHHGEIETDHVNALVEQIAGHVLAELGVVEHDRHDGVIAWLDVEAGLPHVATESPGVGLQLVAQRRRLRE